MGRDVIVASLPKKLIVIVDIYYIRQKDNDYDGQYPTISLPK